MSIENKTPAEIMEATNFTEAELAFVDDMTQAIFEQAAKEDHRPYVLTALCAAIATNIVLQSEGNTDVTTVLEFIRLGTLSQFEMRNHEKTFNH